ncbi:hypothetical protein PIB30_066592 [Stylosanthes scabra]|uniref:Secreted protein n=1 Tax=Stylosanthes scabra TaxID=79078 RepID=A0ABU6XNP4_9FABA|nr:hypothetical protein [Stylosanthes scabra]
MAQSTLEEIAATIGMLCIVSTASRMSLGTSIESRLGALAQCGGSNLCTSTHAPSPGWGVTCALRWVRKNFHDSEFSPSTSANAMGRILELPSYAIASIKCPPYLPNRCVPSILTSGLQCLNASTHGGNV